MKKIVALVILTVLAGCSESDSTPAEPVNPTANPPSVIPGDPLTDPSVDPMTDPMTDPLTDPVNSTPELLGPIGGTGADGEYSQFNDSPFANLDFSGGYFHFENFEDSLLDFPGASANNGDFTGKRFGPTQHDSVDEDDGLIDGNSLDGESWFHTPDTEGVTWSFDAVALGGNLPTHVGIVWTDGRGVIAFEAFDAAGNSLGVLVGNHANASFSGETSDDRFYGVINAAGISSIKISSGEEGVDGGGIELDHLQWGFQGNVDTPPGL